jgi:hypothetical protein
VVSAIRVARSAMSLVLVTALYAGSSAGALAERGGAQPVAAGAACPVGGSSEAPSAGVYVAAAGSDAADGSVEHPFATLARARAAARTGHDRRVYLRAGRYLQRLVLGPEDSGLGLLAFPGEVPVIEGGGTLLALDGVSDAIVQGISLEGYAGSAAALSMQGGARNRIVGNTFLRTGEGVLIARTTDAVVALNRFVDTAVNAVEVKDGADRTLIYCNHVDGTGGTDTSGAGLLLHGVSHARILRNLVENTAGAGIGILNWDQATINVDNAISFNVVRRTNLIATDSGAIYTLGRSQRNTGLRIDHNLVDEARSAMPDPHVIGIYLDDESSGVLVSNNVIRDVQTHAVQIHGGHSNCIVDNVFDLSRTKSGILFQAAPADQGAVAPMTDNEVVDNIFVAELDVQPPAFENLNGGKPRILGNLYRGASAGALTDTTPTDTTRAELGLGAADTQAAGHAPPDDACRAGRGAGRPDLGAAGKSLSPAVVP